MSSFTAVRPFSRCSVKRFVLIFCIGLIVRLGFNITHGWYLFSSGKEPQKIAQEIVRGNGFSSPFLLPTGPTAHLAPGFPVLLAGIYKVFGEGITGLFIADALNAAVSATVGALLPVAALLCGASSGESLLAGLLYAVLPPQPYTEGKGDWEAAIGALLLISAFIAVRREISSRNLQKGRAFAVGLLAGLTGLFLPTLCPVIFGFLTILFLYKRKQIRQLLSYGLIVVLVTFALLGPWLIRNRITFGQWIPVRDNFGLELRVSYWDKATATLSENIRIGNHAVVHPFSSEAESLKVREFGEVAYNHQQLKLATEWIRKHPSRFLQLTRKHFQLFWTSGIRFALLIPFAFWGTVRIWKQDKASLYLLSVILVFEPLVYYFVQFERRYRHPIEWVVTLAAVIGASAIFPKPQKLCQSRLELS
jgi:hypothetical protein